MQFSTLLLLASTFASPLLALSLPYCPVAQCSPSPVSNQCHITTSCISTQPSGQYHCACRAGYKASAASDATDTHYRTAFVGQEYRVFVKPGVACDTLCDEWWLGPGSCKEVREVSMCN